MRVKCVVPTVHPNEVVVATTREFLGRSRVKDPGKDAVRILVVVHLGQAVSGGLAFARHFHVRHGSLGVGIDVLVPCRPKIGQ